MSAIPVPRSKRVASSSTTSSSRIGGSSSTVGPPRKVLLTANPHSPRTGPGSRIRAATGIQRAGSVATGRSVSGSSAGGYAGASRVSAATSARTPFGSAAGANGVRGVVRPGARAGIVGKRVLSNGSAHDENEDPGRMEALEAKMTSMLDLFEEEKMKTEARLMKERQERMHGEDHVKQLQAELQEQRKIAESAQMAESFKRRVDEGELEELRSQHAREKRRLEDELDREREAVAALKATLSQQSTAHLTMESTHAALRAQIHALEDEVKNHKTHISSLQLDNQKLQKNSSFLENELREAESLRRKLHNEVQELRGNIRVFCRVRPSVRNDSVNAAAQGAVDTALATMKFPNEREANQLELIATGESATGTATMSKHHFQFDRVFQPTATQADVFEEVAHLTQSVLDGYNTSIFAYGQTGSGKTHTLEGPPDCFLSGETGSAAPAEAGLIPRAVQMLWSTADALKDKGWKYDFEGQMLEIYLDGINDLLGRESFDKAKHEIKHEKNRTIVSDAVVVSLGSPAQVFALLEKAKKRRQVAATLMNERSSRSHSVFILRVRGQNPTTMESCDAVLNLVDLAGSERLSNSGSASDPQRLKEAQSINKSLSSLADVIAALGQQKSGSHVPYRNSTLTWLLKNSLGGNSKTLMLLALSPMAAHQQESLCSLRFAAKVNATHIGTAKRTLKVDSLTP